MQKLYETERLNAFILDKGAASEFLLYEKENSESFCQYAPQRSKSYYTVTNMEQYCGRQKYLYRQREKLPLVFSRKGEKALVGLVFLSDIVYGSSYSAKIGYSIATAWQRQGYGTEAVSSVVKYAFQKLKLHRIEATIMAKNTPSLAFVDSLGFLKEGTSREYLLVRGMWEDYHQYALLNTQHAYSKKS